MLRELNEVGSTNTWLLENQEGLPDLFTVYTFRQTAGRGQTGNSWESEPGKNLSFSTLFRLSSIEQTTQLNMLIPLAVVRVIGENIGAVGPLTIKWPNDIYWGEKKLAGLLNENVFAGNRPVCSVAGVGLNVNQEVFRSDAPNPVSLKQITGREYELVPLLEAIVREFAELRPLLERPKELRDEYMARLFRREGLHRFQVSSTSPKGAEEFLAAIHDVDEFGRLILKTEDGLLHTFGFKKIRFVL